MIRAIIAIVFLGTLLVLARDNYKNRHKDYSEANGKDTPANQKLQNRSSHTSPHNQRTTADEHTAKEESHWQREESHWEKQIRIEIAALVLSAIAFVGAVFGYISLRSQTHAAWRAAKEAGREADAASRSYIFVVFRGGETISDWTFEKNMGLINVKLLLTNYGAAPAIIKGVGCKVFWGTEGGPPKNSIIIAKTDSLAQAHDLSPDSVVGSKDTIRVSCPDGWPTNSPVFNLGNSASDSIARRRTAINMGYPIWVVGYVSYTDVSGEPHGVAFCAKNDGGVDLVPAGPPDCYARN